jgi:hypothetical protein
LSEPYNAAERSHVKALAKTARFVEKAGLETVRGIMDTSSGRAWMLSVLNRCHIFSASFNTNALSMAFSEGERNVGLQFLKDIMAAAPDMYTVMMREDNERNTAISATRSAPAEPEFDAGGTTLELIE